MKARTTLRQKVPVDATFTDQQLFQQLPLGDKWNDARLVELFFYLLQSRSLSIPDCWLQTMMEFKRDLEAFEHQLHFNRLSVNWLCAGHI